MNDRGGGHKLRLGAALGGALVLAFAVIVGPWPTVSGDFAAASYYRHALGAIRESSSRSTVSRAPGPLRAGWGRAPVEVPAGTPLAGFGARQGKPSEGAHDTLWFKAVALSDGVDTAVLVGSDLLLVPPEVAEAVRRAVGREVPLTADDLLFTASHTHSGPGALAPGAAAREFLGTYDPRVPRALTEACVRAVVNAHRDLQPARMARAEARAADLVRNRTRPGPVDDEISVLLLEQSGGRRCILFGFSAHPTILGSSNRRFSADYPGFAQRLLEEEAGATAVFLGGAVGSMSGRVPDSMLRVLADAGADPRDPFTRARALGDEVARRVARAIENPAWVGEADVVSAGVAFALPPLQWRPVSPRWRVSSVLAHALGLPSRGWMSMVRVGDAVFVALPGDLSGEISVRWKAWAAGQGYDLWCSSFSGEYVGYISPDAYWDDWADAKGRAGYETALMSWCGPRQEAFLTALMQHMFRALVPATGAEPVLHPGARASRGAPPGAALGGAPE